ncbi:MAG: SPOR domain-containing protein [Pseudomonadota bacterium]|nr:SPOR domain-containing protein [Pseudomonadota bacterium]
MDHKLKQRLAGATVLTALAIIFVPIILEGPDDDWSPRVQDIPVPPQIDYQAQVDLQLPDEVPEPTEAPADVPPREIELAVPEPVVAEKEPEPVKEVAPPVPVAQPEPQAKPPPKPKPAPATVAGTWVIQVGSFSQQLNAQGLRDRVRKTGNTVFLREVSTGGKHTWRVLVGPLKDRGEAEKLRDKLTREHNLKGIVIENK